MVSWTDNAFAEYENTQKSTSAGAGMRLNHTIKSWSNNRVVIALSSQEAEYQGLVEAGGANLGIQALTSELGIKFDNPIEICSDASAAIGKSGRVGSDQSNHSR